MMFCEIYLSAWTGLCCICCIVRVPSGDWLQEVLKFLCLKLHFFGNQAAWLSWLINAQSAAVYCMLASKQLRGQKPVTMVMGTMVIATGYHQEIGYRKFRS